MLRGSQASETSCEWDLCLTKRYCKILLLLLPLVLIIIIWKLDGFPILLSGFHMPMLMCVCLPIPKRRTFMWNYKRKQKIAHSIQLEWEKSSFSWCLIDKGNKEIAVLSKYSKDQQRGIGSMTAVWLSSVLSEFKCASKPDPEDTGVKP